MRRRTVCLSAAGDTGEPLSSPDTLYSAAGAALSGWRSRFHYAWFGGLTPAFIYTPTNATFTRNAAIIDSNSADVLTALDRPEEALVRQRRAQEVFKRLSDADPSNVAALNDIAISRFKIAQMLEAAGQIDAAAEDYRASVSIHERLSAQDQKNAAFRQEVASGLRGLATIEAKRGNRALSLDAHGRAVSLSRALETENPGNIGLRTPPRWRSSSGHARWCGSAIRPRPRAINTEAVRVLETLLKAGAIEDTDVETLETARKELSRLQQ
jgi:tetratricopeptide (TPR) repeat protein